jgi:hypothetical protein
MAQEPTPEPTAITPAPGVLLYTGRGHAPHRPGETAHVPAAHAAELVDAQLATKVTQA